MRFRDVQLWNWSLECESRIMETVYFDRERQPQLCRWWTEARGGILSGWRPPETNTYALFITCQGKKLAQSATTTVYRRKTFNFHSPSGHRSSLTTGLGYRISSWNTWPTFKVLMTLAGKRFNDWTVSWHRLFRKSTLTISNSNFVIRNARFSCINRWGSCYWKS